MRHGCAGRQFGRDSSHRKALLRMLVTALLKNEKIETTVAKAKEIRGRVDRVISLARDGSLTARRRVISELPDEPLVIDKLFNEIAPKYADRQSGFTRLIHIGPRPGDAAERHPTDEGGDEPAAAQDGQKAVAETLARQVAIFQVACAAMILGNTPSVRSQPCSG